MNKQMYLLPVFSLKMLVPQGWRVCSSFFLYLYLHCLVTSVRVCYFFVVDWMNELWMYSGTNLPCCVTFQDAQLHLPFTSLRIAFRPLSHHSLVKALTKVDLVTRFNGHFFRLFITLWVLLTLPLSPASHLPWQPGFRLHHSHLGNTATSWNWSPYFQGTWSLLSHCRQDDLSKRQTQTKDQLWHLWDSWKFEPFWIFNNIKIYVCMYISCVNGNDIITRNIIFYSKQYRGGEVDRGLDGSGLAMGWWWSELGGGYMGLTVVFTLLWCVFKIIQGKKLKKIQVWSYPSAWKSSMTTWANAQTI